MSIRISDSYLSHLLVGDMNRSLAQLLRQQRMAGTLQRVNAYADDPRAVASIARLGDLIATNDSYVSNVGRSRTLVDGTDAALQELGNILSELRVIALRESSAQSSGDTMAISAEEVANLQGRMLEVLNTSVEGQYLFGGHRTDTAPFALVGGTVTYQGDAGEIRVATGPHSTVAVNISGDAFAGPQGFFATVERLAAGLAAEDHDAVRDVLDGLDGLEDSLGRLLIRNGGRQRDLDWADEVLAARDERLRVSLSAERDADVARVATELSRAEAAYQASLMVTSKLFQYNLMDFLG